MKVMIVQEVIVVKSSSFYHFIFFVVLQRISQMLRCLSRWSLSQHRHNLFLKVVKFGEGVLYLFYLLFRRFYSFGDSLFVHHGIVVIAVIFNIDSISWSVQEILFTIWFLWQLYINMTLKLNYFVFLFIINDHENLLVAEITKFNGFLHQSSLSLLVRDG